MSTTNYLITPSQLGEYIKYKQCPRYAKLRTGDTNESSDRDYKEAFNSLNPLLSEEGRAFESDLYDDIRPLAYDVIESWRDYDAQAENDETLRNAVIETAQRSAGEAPLVLMQAHFAGPIGEFYVPGDADLICLWPTGDKRVHIRIFDVKASFDEKTYHQIQTSCYTILYEQVLGHESVPDDISYEIDAGILFRDSDWSALDTDTLPRFDPAPREADIARLLQYDGELSRIYDAELDTIDYQLDSKCRTCPFNESCYVRSIEAKDIRLLELTRGEQAAFRKHGLETLDDVASLIDPLDDPRPYEYGDPSIRAEHQETVSKLAEDHSIGERVTRLAQKAQAKLGEINPNHPDAHDAPWMQWLKGSGDGSLPDDNPKFDKKDMSIERGSLIRVYLNVQWDYLRDRVSIISGRVTSTKYDGTPLVFGEMMSSDGLSDDPDIQAKDEERLLKDAFEQLFKAIRIVATLSDLGDEAPVHLYVFSRGERDALMDAVKRHPSLTEATAVRDLLGLRPGIDQAMVSVVQEEVTQRLAPKQLSTGLLPLMSHFHPSGSGKFEFGEWTYTDESGADINLRQVFYHEMFDYSVPYKREGSSIRFLLGENANEDGWYPARGRFGAEIPLQYIWAAEGIDGFGPEWTDDPQYKGIIELYRWRDSKRTQRITTEDVQTLSKKLTHALHHIERGIVFKNTDMHKEPFELPDIDAFSLGESTLANACKEYLDLEYSTSKQDALDLYRKPLKDRILNGESLPVRIESAKVSDGFLTAEGQLIVDEFDFSDPKRVAMATRVKGSDEGTTGSWMVATELRRLSSGDIVQNIGKPEHIMNSAPVTVKSINPRTGKVELVGFPNGGKKHHAYRTWHRGWTENPDESFDTYIGQGAMFILDPQSDDMTAERAGKALRHADASKLYELVQNIVDGTTTDPQTNKFPRSALDEYTTYCDTLADPSPNQEQQEFIAEGTAQVSLLQGPPGTGKTSGALSHALLARAYAMGSQNKHMRAIVTGASNKSVDELLDDVATNLTEFQSKHQSDALDDVKLVRFVNEAPANPLPNVEYVNYHEDDAALQRLEQRLQPPEMRQMTLGQVNTDAQPHLILFTTPSRVAGYMNKHSMFGYPNNPFEMGPQMFDCFAMDEASMLPLPQFLLAGAFITEDAQLLIGGDQRQMPPVQKHDWDAEDRRTVEQAAPYLSTLDFFRLLRGDTLDNVEEEVLDAAPNATIPMTRLQQTYRCHTTVAEFLRRWVYAQDNIDYQSDLTHTIPAVSGATDGLTAALSADDAITLVLHDDSTSQQSNYTEARIAEELVAGLPDSETLGIVTPHNSQKGLLSAMCDPKAHVDTVERFQGGQRDVMLLSATVSDPDYLNAEADFILNLNRLNVALSRMKKKLIVIAPQTLFNILPHDVEGYENSTIWKGLYNTVGADDGAPVWSGSLADFTGDGDDESNHASLRVYSA